MSGTLIGKWDLVSSENIEELLIKLGIGYLKRKMALTAKPTIIIELNDGSWSVTTSSTIKTTTIKFQLNVEFDEETLDGRKVKTTVVGDEKKIVQTQRDNNGSIICVITREINDKDEHIVHITAGDVTAIRVYKRQ